MCLWWDDPSNRDWLEEIVSTINGALSRENSIAACGDLFPALNNVWQTHVHVQVHREPSQSSSRRPSERDRFTWLITDTLCPEDLDNLVREESVAELSGLAPEIMSEEVLRRRVADYGRSRDIRSVPTEVARDASGRHRAFREALANHQRDRRYGTQDVVRALTGLLYVVRSNIAHGEKTPYGPDTRKRDRDERVCRSVLPVLRVLIDYLFGHPSRKLIAYGSLGPGRPNESVLRRYCIQWRECDVKGKLAQRDQLVYLRPSETGVAAAHIGVATCGRVDWDELDRFEGSGYRRQLGVAKLTDHLEVAHVYVDADERWALDRDPLQSRFENRQLS